MGVVTQGIAVPLSLGMSGFNASLSAAGSGLSKLQKMASISLKVGLAGTAAGLGIAVKEASHLEQQMAKLHRASDLSDAGFNRLGVDLKRFAGYADGIKLDSVFEIATIGAKLGIAGDQLNLFTRDIAKLRVAIDENDLPTQEMTEGIASMLSVFHRGTDEAIRFGSALNRLDLMSTASARDILDVSRRMSGTATLLGMSPQKTLALATALRQARVPVETAGTSMSQIMGRMASKKDSGHFAQLAGVKPLDWLQLVGSDPLEAIKKLELGLQKLDRIKAIRKLDELHLDGQRVRGTLLQLGTVIKDLDKYVAESEKEWDGMNSVLKSNEIMGATMQAQWTKLANNFKLTASALGISLLPALKALANGLVRLMHDIRASIEANKDRMMAWGEAVGKVLGNVGGLWRNFPLYVTYAKIAIGEKLDQIAEIGKRFGKALWANMKWGFSSAFTFLKDLIGGLASYIGELVTNLAANIGAQINNALVASLPAAVSKTLGLVKQAIPAIAAQGNHFANVGAGIPAAPGFGGMFDNLPNRAPQLAAQGGLIGLANRIQERQLNNRIARDAAKDEAARADAERARAGPMGPPDIFKMQRKRENLQQQALKAQAAQPRIRDVANMAERAAMMGLPGRAMPKPPPPIPLRDAPKLNKAQQARADAAKKAREERKRRLDAIRAARRGNGGRLPGGFRPNGQIPRAPGANMQQPEKEKDLGDAVQAMNEVKGVNSQMLEKLASIDSGISMLLSFG